MSDERDPHDDARRGNARSPGLGAARGSLCVACKHVQTITSARGSTFWLCRRSKDDARFPKYPPQPVVVCSGHER